MNDRVIALSGGIGGAKLALGLDRVLSLRELILIANTGDDFDHLGFHICPDIDTLIYTLGGISNTELGWGRADETWAFMEDLRRRDPAQAWFLLGDRDLETHHLRGEALQAGMDLTEATARLARHYGVGATILPMSDDPVRTWVQVEDEAGSRWLPFQEYFVKLQCRPAVRGIEYRGAAGATLPAALGAALRPGRVRAVILCPSNPFLSIDPILAVPGLRQSLRDSGAPIVAVSPIVGGRAIKGPTAKIMRELGLPADVPAVAAHYRGLIDGLVIDGEDAGLQPLLQQEGLQVLVTDTVMRSLADRMQLARDVLDFADTIAGSPASPLSG
ncbi:MAG: 2-phospho-L-lactate transferase [Xanthomonadales bacterium]|nr:2-phospho-L-lactate transferase [Xanthomonadales bacterium]